MIVTESVDLVKKFVEAEVGNFSNYQVEIKLMNDVDLKWNMKNKRFLFFPYPSLDRNV